MEITRQADYAMRAVLYLATYRLASTREIAEAQSVPREYLAKIVQELARAGIVRTQRGVGGGITLARPPEEITLLDVLEAIEGPVAVNRCFSHPNECPRESFCAVHHEMYFIQKSLAQMFSRINFARLARREAELKQELEAAGAKSGSQAGSITTRAGRST